MADRVLVTGITGFIGSHVAKRLLDKGYNVRGTVRNKVKGERIFTALTQNLENPSRLELVEANLGADTGWADAVKDCKFIQHIASPFPLESPSNREALVPEARAGAQRVLEHGFSAGVERIVLTSSMASMMGQKGRGNIMQLTEEDWSDPDWKPLTAYPVSKTRAELSAWAYAKAQKHEKNLVTICPGIVFGPDSYKNGGASLGLIKAMFDGEFPMVPKVAYPIIDVRDCAAIHIAAMTAERAGGRRLLAGANTLWFSGIANVLREEYPRAKKLPKSELPNFVVNIMAKFDDRVKAIRPDLGTFHSADMTYVTNLTGVVPRPAKEAIISAARSMAINGDIEVT